MHKDSTRKIEQITMTMTIKLNDPKIKVSTKNKSRILVQMEFLNYQIIEQR